MATIGTFKKSANNEFTGEIVTLSVQARSVRIVPETRTTGDNAPSHRAFVGSADIGAAWTKRRSGTGTVGTCLGYPRENEHDLHQAPMRTAGRRCLTR
ncbi:uncharacterized protein DUF736 [Aminobacter sp. AP02]|nr:uncharacterized protein DUF736 [Aminobacter sp. AP02]